MWKYCIQSDSFTIQITGGSVRILDRHTEELIKVFKGYTYLYTGDIHPNESEFFALENGKHFYVYSLKNFEMIKKITLPRTYESIDVCGFYSDDGKIINIPAQRYICEYKSESGNTGHYEFVLFKYQSSDYTLIETVRIFDYEKYHWNFTF